MEKDRAVFEVKKTIKHMIIFGIPILIHLKDFVYHKRPILKQCQNGGFEKKWLCNTYYRTSTQRICCRASPICSTTGHLRMEI